MDFEESYEINRTANYIYTHQFNRVALQFPDELLKDSVRVVRALQEKLRTFQKCDDNGGEGLVEGRRNVGLFVMADTTYGSCCVDEVGAAHVNADCVIHYGHTCLSPTSTLPAFLVFGKASIDVLDCAQKICSFASGSNKSVLVLFGLEYTHAIHDLNDAFRDETLTSSISSSKLDISCANVLSSEISPPEKQKTSNGQVEAANNLCDSDKVGIIETHTSSYNIGGLTWTSPRGKCIEDYLLFWVGPDNSAFANVVLTFNTCEIVRYDPTEKCVVTDVSQLTRIIKRRYYLVEKAKDANIVGILVGTLAVAGYRHMINQMKELVTKSGKKAYTIVVGRPNPAKLANFPECDVFIYVSCAQTALLDSKEFLAPVITPFEAMLAFNRGSQWTGKYTMEFRDLVNFTPARVEDDIDEPRYSFLQGGYVEDIDHDESVDESEDDMALAISTEKVLQLRSENTDALAKMTPKSGAEFLAKRSYQGLDINHDGPTPKPVLTGRTGRAAAYEDEKTQQL